MNRLSRLVRRLLCLLLGHADGWPQAAMPEETLVGYQCKRCGREKRLG